MTDIVENVEHERSTEIIGDQMLLRLDAIIYLLEIIANQDIGTTQKQFGD